MIPVVIPTPVTLDSVAARALRMEGIEAREYPCIGPTSYAHLLSLLWRNGDGFLLVEHDVAPWPGAVDGLLRCGEHVCAHRYPFNLGEGRGVGLGYSLGCLRVSAEFTRSCVLDPHVESIAWHDLDSWLWKNTLAGVDVHVHEPPVAHARGTGR